MILKSIDIENFACFQHYHMDFSPGMSVLIGRNGAGKTSLLKAVVYALNFIFTADRTMGEEFLSAGNPDLRVKSISNNEFYRRKAVGESSQFANLHGVLQYGGENLQWDIFKRSTPKASVNPSRYRNAYHAFMRISKQQGTLPLLAYYSDSFPHKEANLSSFAKEQIANQDNILRNFGYYQWDNETACTSIWQNRLENSIIMDLQIGEDNPFIHDEVEYVTSCLRQCSIPINNQCDKSYIIEKVFVIFDENKQPQLWLHLKNGNDVLFDNLPAGYKRIYSIVLDLAYRAYLLHRGPSPEPKGIVLIDEVALHLHPTLAMEILERYRRLFPSLQFIVTTHSPLVVTSLRSNDGVNQVYRLMNGKETPHLMPNLYGLDYNTSLINALETDGGDDRIRDIRETILRAKRLKHERLERLKKEELSKYLSKSDYEQVISQIEAEYQKYAVDQ